jgi:phosphatidylserine synthase
MIKIINEIIQFYKKNRKTTPLNRWYEYEFVTYFWSGRLSPFFSYFFVKNKFLPNTITIYMILSGWIGAFLFAFDNIYLKIIGYIFIHLWFIFDCSDGEVARLTKTFSKMGKELDYVAHIVNHPFFAISFGISALQLYKHNNIISDCWILVIFLLLAIFNLIGRGLMSLHLIYDMKKNSEQTTKKFTKLTPKKFVIYILHFFCQFPNIAIIYPIFYFIDMHFHTFYSLYYIMLVLLVTILVVSRMIFNTMKRFYKL